MFIFVNGELEALARHSVRYSCLVPLAHIITNAELSKKTVPHGGLALDGLDSPLVDRSINRGTVRQVMDVLDAAWDFNLCEIILVAVFDGHCYRPFP